jgi:hypothetical protein
MDDHLDKEWARKYILDPLTAPEPHQETGLGSSHFNHYRASLQAQSSSQRQQQQHHRQPPSSNSRFKDKFTRLSGDIMQPEMSNQTDKYPTPPQSGSPNRKFHPSNPFASSEGSADMAEDKTLISPPDSPDADRATRAHQRQSSMNSSSPTHQLGPRSDPGHGPSRSRSLHERFPGDLAPRPLDVIRNDARAAEKPHRHRKRISDVDQIDALDTIGGTYHHGGPYDATLISRNLNKKYSPVAAVQDSNMETLRATPREYIIDSLERHLPLQGTATVPSGGMDISGRRMSYEEGADLMREPDAPGGAFKRWDHMKYHPDDLKGKGEPSYTFEKDLKEKKRAQRGEPDEIEMQSGLYSRGGPSKHQRSISIAFRDNSSSSGNAYNNSDLQRRNSTGKKLSNGLKRRWGSLREKTKALVE